MLAKFDGKEASQELLVIMQIDAASSVGDLKYLEKLNMYVPYIHSSFLTFTMYP